MNTNTIKSFARNARLQLCEAVVNQMLFWGFNEKGETENKPIKVGGGFSFRGKIYDNASNYDKWEKLERKIAGSKVNYQDVVEEAAYAWFNRLVAIKVLEENNFIDPVLRFEQNSRIPRILQEAKQGNHQITHSGQKSLLTEALLNNRDEEAFAILILNYCHKHPLLETVFGKTDDYTELLIPQNLLSSTGFLAQLNDPEIISEESFKEVELIGWLYQFYISDKKDEVFKSFKKKKKARAEDIPAATQIFTPRWIVEYMVQNTIGKLYLDFDETSELKKEMKYLVESDDNSSTPLIKDLEELTLIDPASGSGHILVVGLEWLFKMYREQAYSAKMAIDNILHHNLYGLDIDDRAMQLGRFAVLLKSAQLLEESIIGEGRNFINKKDIVLPHNYAFPEERGFVSEDIELLTDNKHVKEIYAAFKELRQGKNIGAALKIQLSQEAREVLIQKYQAWSEREGQLDLQEQAVWETLREYIEVALVLTKKFAGVAANPPYMGQVNMNADLKKYVNQHYKESKADLMTVFMEVIPEFTKDGFRFALINLPSWMFLSTFAKLRNKYIKNYQLSSLLHMGRGVFGIDFGSVAFVVQKNHKNKASGNYFRLHQRNFQHIYYEDIEKLFLYSKGNSDYKYDFQLYRDEDGIKGIPEEGMEHGQQIYYPNIPQSNFEKIPGSPIAYWLTDRVISHFDKENRIVDVFNSGGRIKTHSNIKYLRLFWEVSHNRIGNNGNWIFVEDGGGKRKWFGNRITIVDWSNEAKEFYQSKGGLSNPNFWNRIGISWSIISSNGASFRFKDTDAEYTSASPTLIPKKYKEEQLLYTLAFLNSNYVNEILKAMNPTINTTSGDVG